MEIPEKRCKALDGTKVETSLTKREDDLTEKTVRASNQRDDLVVKPKTDGETKGP